MSINVLESAQRIINAVLGEPYGDGDMVTDIGVGYANRYGDADTVWVLGNWNDKDRYDADTQTRIVTDTMPSRLYTALSRIGVECEWLDEWSSCYDCGKLVRTSPDSYSYTPQFAYLDECDLVCSDCIESIGEDALESAGLIDNAQSAVTFFTSTQLESFGYQLWNEGHSFESGWFDGQTDDPATVLSAVKSAHPESSVVFLIDESSQFYSRWSAYFKLIDSDSE